MTDTDTTKAITGDAARVTLKSVKINEALSEETTCYSATVYLDGKKVGTASNRGHGGEDFYDWTDKGAGAEVERIGDAYDKYGLCILIEALLNRFEDEKVAKRYLKKGLPVSVFIRVGYGTESRTALPTMRQVKDVQAEYPGKEVRVVDLTKGTKTYDTLEAFCLAYPRALKPSVWTETEKVKEDTLVFVVDGVAHEFTDAAHKTGNVRLFNQYCDQQNALTKAGKL